MTGDKVPLMTAEAFGRLPHGDGLATATELWQSDIVIEVVSLGGAPSAMPARIRLGSNTWLDTASLGAADGAKSRLVHLNSAVLRADGQYVAQTEAKPVPAALEEKLKKQSWRTIMGVPEPVSAAGQITPFWWATDFKKRIASGEAKGLVSIEGTFESYQKGGANAKYGSVKLKELPDKFNFEMTSPFPDAATQAEALKKKNFSVTMRLTVNLDAQPKLFVSTHCSWTAPLAEQYQYFKKTTREKQSLRHMLALVDWCQTRQMGNEARLTLADASNFITKEGLSPMGPPQKAVRVHLADEVFEYWFYEKVAPVLEGNQIHNWEGQQIGLDFYGFPMASCVILKANSKGPAWPGDLYPL